MAERDWSPEIQAVLGDGELSLDDVVGAIRTLARRGQSDAAFQLATSVLAQTTEGGDSPTTDAILRAIEPAAATLSAEERGWLKSYRALELIARNRTSEAEANLREAWRLAKRSKGLSLQSNVALNLGALAQIKKSKQRAIRWYRVAFDKGVSIEDYDLVTKVVSNFIGLAIEHGETSRANNLLLQLERMLSGVRDPSRRATLHYLLGGSAVARGDFPQAIREFRKSASLARKSGRPLLQATVLQNLGAALLDSGRPREALKRLGVAQEISERIGAVPIGVTVLQTMAIALVRIGQHAEAKTALAKVISLASEIDDPGARARATMDLGAVEAQDAEYGIAAEHIRDAFVSAAALDLDWKHEAARNLISVGVMAADAVLVHSSVQKVISQLSPKDHIGRADAIWHAAQGLIELGAPMSEVLELLNASLKERKLVRDRLKYAHDAEQAGAILRDHGSYDAAAQFFTQALESYGRASDAPLAFHVRNDRALIWVRQGKLNQARRELNRCLNIAKRLRNRPMEIQARGNLGETLRQLRDVRGARTHLNVALRLARRLRDYDQVAWLLGNRALVALDEGDLARAERLATEQLEMGRTLDNQSIVSSATGSLANLSFRRGQFRKAALGYRAAARLNVQPRNMDAELHFAEDIASALESYSKAGDSRNAERMAQELVNAAQQFHFEAFAADSLVRAGRFALEREDQDLAAGLFFAAIAITATAPAEEDLGAEALTRRLLEVVIHVESSRLAGRAKIYEAIVAEFRKHTEEGPEMLTNILPEAISAAELALSKRGPQNALSTKRER
jgi:tetratricopeptide (TPR) repeat protein